jgi:hypothetical protein
MFFVLLWSLIKNFYFFLAKVFVAFCSSHSFYSINMQDNKPLILSYFVFFFA